MVIKTKYKFGDILYLKTDPEQTEHTLIAVIQEPGSLVYRLRDIGAETVEVYEFEVSDTKDPLKSMGIDSKEVEEDGG
jgi:hypothetical protein